MNKYQNLNFSMFWNFIFQVFPIIFGLISIPYIIEIYGKGLFSIYSLSVAYIISLSYLNFGIAPFINRSLSSQVEPSILSKAGIFWNGFFSTLFLSLFFTVLFTLLALYFSAQVDFLNEYRYFVSSTFFIKIILLTPFIMTIILLRAVLEAELNFFLSSIVRASINSVILLSPLIAYFFSFDFEMVPEIIFFTYLVSIIFLFFKFRYLLKLKSLRIDFSFQKETFTSGFFLSLIAIGMLIFLNVDRYILGFFVSLEILALYLIPLDIFGRLSLIYGSLGAVFYPVFSKLYATQHYEELRYQFIRFYKILFSLLFITIVFFSLFLEEFLFLWLGEIVNEEIIKISRILLIGIFLTGLTVVPFRFLISLKKEDELGKAYFLGVFLYLPITLVFINASGIIGAAYSFLIRSIVELFFLNLKVFSLSKKLENFKAISYFLISISLLPLFLVPLFYLEILNPFIRILTFIFLISMLLLFISKPKINFF